MVCKYFLPYCRLFSICFFCHMEAFKFGVVLPLSLKKIHVLLIRLDLACISESWACRELDQSLPFSLEIAEIADSSWVGGGDACCSVVLSQFLPSPFFCLAPHVVHHLCPSTLLFALPWTSLTFSATVTPPEWGKVWVPSTDSWGLGQVEPWSEPGVGFVLHHRLRFLETVSFEFGCLTLG